MCTISYNVRTMQYLPAFYCNIPFLGGTYPSSGMKDSIIVPVFVIIIAVVVFIVLLDNDVDALVINVDVMISQVF